LSAARVAHDLGHDAPEFECFIDDTIPVSRQVVLFTEDAESEVSLRAYDASTSIFDLSRSRRLGSV
jgi:hypothetical protein